MPAFAEIQERKQAVWFKHVVVATDFSAASERALAHALPLAQRYGSSVSIVHAIPPEMREITFGPLPRELDHERLQAEKEMTRLADDACMRNLDPRMILERGEVWDVLSWVIQREDADLLVMGTHGRGGLNKLVLGSVAEDVLRRTSCPVLTVGPSVPPVVAGKSGFKTILFATDFGPSAPRSFSYALSLAEDCQAKLILLHVVPPMPSTDIGPGIYGPGVLLAQDLDKWQATQKKNSARKLMELIPPDARLKSAPEYLVELDFPPEGILDAAAARNVDLIVMGESRTAAARVAAHVPWSLTHDIICRAKCPVLTVLV